MGKETLNTYEVMLKTGSIISVIGTNALVDDRGMLDIFRGNSKSLSDIVFRGAPNSWEYYRILDYETN